MLLHLAAPFTVSNLDKKMFVWWLKNKLVCAADSQVSLKRPALLLAMASLFGDADPKVLVQTPVEGCKSLSRDDFNRLFRSTG
jgi:hypothetical protein